MPSTIHLPSAEMPRQWYNAVSDIPGKLDPPLDPRTGQPLRPEMLAAIFPPDLIAQEISEKRWIDIPEEVLSILGLWRPTPLVRAERLEKAVGARARIYYKNESVSPAGSHKPNTAVAQAYYNLKAGVRNLTTETGAGQWGSALAFATCLFGMKCLVYMVKCSYEQKPFRRSLIALWGGEAIPSPSATTAAGRAILAQDPHSSGSLGIAISEAVEVAAQDPKVNYALGSVLNHVLLHQTVIGLEAKRQLAMASEELPAAIIACCGGGSNFGGIVLPFLPERLAGASIRFIAVEPTACPTMTRGHFAYDYGDTAHLTPLLKMHTLGSGFVPPGIHAGGLRYHGMAPIVSALIRDRIVEAKAYGQRRCFEAAIQFARCEGIVPAPETSHAIAAVIDEAQRPENSGKCLLFSFSGHGHFDMAAYDKYLQGQMQDYDLPDAMLAEAAASLPRLPS